MSDNEKVFWVTLFSGVLIGIIFTFVIMCDLVVY